MTERDPINPVLNMKYHGGLYTTTAWGLTRVMERDLPTTPKAYRDSLTERTEVEYETDTPLAALLMIVASIDYPPQGTKGGGVEDVPEHLQ